MLWWLVQQRKSLKRQRQGTLPVGLSFLSDFVKVFAQHPRGAPQACPPLPQRRATPSNAVSAVCLPPQYAHFLLLPSRPC